MNQNSSATRILLIDDDAELCELVSHFLSARGFEVHTEGQGEQGLQRAMQGEYDFMILDVMLPGLDGFEVLRRLRSSGGAASALPVMMLTAHGDEVDRIVGLEMGADDYLPKPFNPRELLARMRAILRRATSEPSAQSTPRDTPDEAEKIRLGEVEINVGARSASCSGTPLELTATEFDLLHVLLRSAGRVVSRDHLAREALGRRLMPYDRSLDIHISKLRQKLGHDVERIKTIRGVGYLYAREE